MIVATLDANVLVSGARGLLQDTSSPGEILRRLSAGRFILITSDHIEKEAAKALRKPYFQQHVTHEESEAFRQFLANASTWVPITVTVQGVATHAEDDLILATALSGNADYLVTGDKGLLAVGSYRGVTIVTPRDFLDILENDD